MNIRLIVAALVIFTILASAKAKGPVVITQMEPFISIAKHQRTEKQLIASIADLPLPAKEPTNYWNKIANDESYPDFHSRYAAVYLFKRHVRAGQSLTDLSKLVDHPSWLHYSDITLVTSVAGLLPVQSNVKDSTFYIRVLPEEERSPAVIYIRITGKMAESNFENLIMGKANSKTRKTLGKAKIAQIGFSGIGSTLSRPKIL